MERRKILLSMLQQSQTPISGSALGKQTGVSRQVVVQDVAILRTEGVLSGSHRAEWECAYPEGIPYGRAGGG